MSYLKKYDNYPDFDYFTRNYREFEKDFSEFSALKTPLTFLTDDIRMTMRASGQNFFVLDASNSKERTKIKFNFDLKNDIYTYKGYERVYGKYE